MSSIGTSGPKVQVLLDGENILSPAYDVMDLRRKVGMVFQKPTPFPMSIFDNVAFGLKHALPPGTGRVADRVEEALEPGGPLGRSERPLEAARARPSPGGSSSGSASPGPWWSSPRILLMDEPCSAIDPIATARIEDLIHDLKGTYTIAIVTHNMQQAARVSDFTAFFYQGHIVEFGPTQKIFTTPAHKQTEDYITGRFG